MVVDNMRAIRHYTHPPYEQC